MGAPYETLRRKRGDRIVVLYFAAMVEIGQAEHIIAKPRHPYTKLLADSAPVVGRPLTAPEQKGSELPDPLNPPSGCLPQPARRLMPSLADLTERFGMAKGAIREAQGLIKTRTGPGGGSFVHEVSRQRAKVLLGHYFYFKVLTIGDFFQLRLTLEPELAACVAGKSSDGVLPSLLVTEYRALAAGARPSAGVGPRAG